MNKFEIAAKKIEQTGTPVHASFGRGADLIKKAFIARGISLGAVVDQTGNEGK